MVRNTIGNGHQDKGDKGINNPNEAQEYGQVGGSFRMRGVLLLLAGQPGAYGSACFVGQEKCAADNGDLDRHGPGKHLLKKIFPGL
jgi:hypothetical protein